MTNQIMIASEMNDGQIENFVSKLRDALRKNRQHFSKDSAQHALGVPNIGMEFLALIRAHAEAFGNMVVRHATVNRERSQREALVATGRKLHLNESVVKTMPAASGNIETIFVNLGRNVDCDKLDDELDKLGYELIVDPQGLTAINEADRAFADGHPNGIQWKDSKGNYCFVVFHAWRDGRRVDVRVVRSGEYWSSLGWFPCRRKMAL